MVGDIVQDQRGGWFFRDNGDGTLDNLSDPNGNFGHLPAKVQAADIKEPVVLVRDGEPTGEGDRLATRVALFLHRKRYANV